jgi:hypothetical protein
MLTNCLNCDKLYKPPTGRKSAKKYCSHDCYREYQRRHRDAAFWLHVDKSGDCWNWTSTRLPAGYGMFWRAGKYQLAHRVSYEITTGAHPGTFMVLHSCDNPSCVRPDHLSLGTQKANMEDKVAKGRAATGDKHGAHTHPDRFGRR